MKIFISGGCKNGKSYYAQRLAKQQEASHTLYYIATMKAVDQEDETRIKRHCKERKGWGFTTLEQYCDIENILDVCDIRGSFLVDSLTALLANEMFGAKAEKQAGSLNEKVAAGLLKVIGQINNIVIVSDYIYSDAMLYDPLTEEYRKSLASLDQLAAKHCDIVIEVSFAQPIVHKGTEAVNALFNDIL